ncbi:MAG: hypothetical protein LRZ93_04490 [Clostridiales bacterium]|nr:hypothetical protein [Clostridiales bacterium]
MESFDKDIITFLSSSIFKNLLKSHTLQIAQLNFVTSLLIKIGIPFDVPFTPRTQRDDASASLTIYINPNTTVRLSFILIKIFKKSNRNKKTFHFSFVSVF